MDMKGYIKIPCLDNFFLDMSTIHILLLKRYPVISFSIHVYPFVSKISVGANSQMTPHWFPTPISRRPYSPRRRKSVILLPAGP